METQSLRQLRARVQFQSIGECAQPILLCVTYRMIGTLQGADPVMKLDWLDPPLPYTGASTEGSKMVLHNERRVRYQELPFGERMRRTGPHCKTKEHRNESK